MYLGVAFFGSCCVHLLKFLAILTADNLFSNQLSGLPVILSRGTGTLRNHDRHLPTPSSSDMLFPISVKEARHPCENSCLYSALSL